MRVYYDNRGRARGYSTGIGGYFWLQFLQFSFALLVIVPIFLMLLAAVLFCAIGWGIASLLGKETAAESWHRATTSTWGVLDRFGKWNDRRGQ